MSATTPELVCRNCGAVSAPGMRFCGQCGTALETAPQEDQAERRLVTVLFCDLVGSTELSGRLDPEELREVIRDYQRTAADTVAELGGHVAQYLGDGVLVYFGYPTANEDDPERAVLAGLRLVGAFEDDDEGPELAVRVGIHTGNVVAGEVGTAERSERLALGLAPNLAARVQGLAEPGQVLISVETERLAHDRFDLHSLGPKMLKGLEEPIEIFRVVGERESVDRSSRLRVVGREQERSLLHEKFDRAADEGQLVALQAEAGLGKTTLLRELHQQSGRLWLEGRCSQVDTASPMRPLLQIARQLFSLSATDDGEAAIAKVSDSLHRYGVDDPVISALLCKWLSLLDGDAEPASSFSMQKRRQIVLSTLAEALAAASREQPLIVLVEDVHWADPSTVEFLELAAPVFLEGRVLLLVTSRPPTPAFLQQDVLGGAPVTAIGLDRLPAADVAALAQEVAEGCSLPRAVLDRLVDRAEGIPLFAEELTRSLLESGALHREGDRWLVSGDLDEQSIPATLQGSLNSRLDRLGDAKLLAQRAAVLGRDFQIEWLEAIVDSPGETVRDQLRHLIDAGLLEVDEVTPGQLSFRHALLHEAAYRLLLRRRRTQEHLVVAQTLSERFPRLEQTQPQFLARHWGEGGEAATAAPLWLRAGTGALHESANLEAIEFFHRGLDQVGQLSEGTERDLLELNLQASLTEALIASSGYVSTEIETNNSRKLELCDRIGNPLQRFFVLLSVTTFELIRGRTDDAREHANAMQSIADAIGEDLLLVGAELAGCSIGYYQGRFEEAETLGERALTRKVEDDGSFRAQEGADPGVTLLYTLALVYWHRGRREEALAYMQRSVELAREIGHPFSQAAALRMQCELLHLDRDPSATLQAAQACVQLSNEKGFPIWTVQALMFEQWGQALGAIKGEPSPEDLEANIGLLSEGLDAYRASGCRLSQPFYQGLFADVLCAAGRFEEAERELDSALELVEQTGDRCYQAELERLRGTVRSARQAEGSDICFRRALEIARAQGSLSLEERAAAALNQGPTATG